MDLRLFELRPYPLQPLLKQRGLLAGAGAAAAPQAFGSAQINVHVFRFSAGLGSLWHITRLYLKICRTSKGGYMRLVIFNQKFR